MKRQGGAQYPGNGSGSVIHVRSESRRDVECRLPHRTWSLVEVSGKSECQMVLDTRILILSIFIMVLA